MGRLLLGLVLGCGAIFIGCGGRRQQGLREETAYMVQRIDSFTSKMQRLPEDLSELGYQLDESGPLYYERIDSVSYRIWYSQSLGESAVWDSRTRRWQD